MGCTVVHVDAATFGQQLVESGSQVETCRPYVGGIGPYGAKTGQIGCKRIRMVAARGSIRLNKAKWVVHRSF